MICEVQIAFTHRLIKIMCLLIDESTQGYRGIVTWCISCIFMINKQQKFYSLSKPYKQIRRFEQKSVKCFCSEL